MPGQKNKGGRPRLGAEVRRCPLNTRTSPEMRAMIEQAAAANGLSMTLEVERRLIRSFEGDEIRQIIRDELAILVGRQQPPSVFGWPPPWTATSVYPATGIVSPDEMTRKVALGEWHGTNW